MGSMVGFMVGLRVSGPSGLYILLRALGYRRVRIRGLPGPQKYVE